MFQAYLCLKRDGDARSAKYRGSSTPRCDQDDHGWVESKA